MIGEIKSICDFEVLPNLLQRMKVADRAESETLESESEYEGVIKAFSELQWGNLATGAIFLP